MSKKIIQINEDLCVGCGLCANTCKQGALEIVNGKAKVTRDDYCDGIGNCMPVCPVGAITFSDIDVKVKNPVQCLHTQKSNTDHNVVQKQWPIQIKLVPETAPYFDHAHLVIAADCTAYSYANFHKEFANNKALLIGCPKLDEGDYTEKLTTIIKQNAIKALTIVRMEVPCCGGIERAATQALQNSGKFIPWQVVTISTDGRLLEL
ncbi:MAG: 4Fe-4S binding protein [Eubacteriales bacterium]